VAGIGDSAYLMFMKSGPTQEPTDHAILVVHQGVHTVAVSLAAERKQSPQSLQPTLTTMAKAALAKLR
jgi:hypothetical protein